MGVDVSADVFQFHLVLISSLLTAAQCLFCNSVLLFCSSRAE